MRYKLEWNLGKFESNDWKEIEAHSQFRLGSVFERTPIGWCAV